MWTELRSRCGSGNELGLFGWSQIPNSPRSRCRIFVWVRKSNSFIFYITLLKWKFLLKWYNFLWNFHWNREFLLCTTQHLGVWCKKNFPLLHFICSWWWLTNEPKRWIKWLFCSQYKSYQFWRFWPVLPQSWNECMWNRYALRSCIKRSEGLAVTTLPGAWRSFNPPLILAQ